MELEKSCYHMGLSKVSTTGPSGASASPGRRAGAVPPGVAGGRCCALAGRLKVQISLRVPQFTGEGGQRHLRKEREQIFNIEEVIAMLLWDVQRRLHQIQPKCWLSSSSLH